MDNRCQVFKSDGFDLTGEHAVECNAPADYCPVCDVMACAECHSEITGSRTPHEKKPAIPVGGERDSHTGRRANPRSSA